MKYILYNSQVFKCGVCCLRFSFCSSSDIFPPMVVVMFI